MKALRDLAAKHLNPRDPWHAQLIQWADWRGGLTPDGERYLVMHRQAVPKPYHYRWLPPQLARDDRDRWAAMTYLSLLAMLPAMKYMTGKWRAGLFMFGLRGVWAINRKHPVLVDPPAMFAAIVAAGAVRRRHWTMAILASLISGACKESGPVFASTYCLNPLPLIGLASPIWRHLLPEGDDVYPAEAHTNYVLHHRLETAWSSRKSNLLDWRRWLAPWGALLAGFASDLRTVATLIAGYGSSIVSTDDDRLYGWAWPILAENAVGRLGDWWVPALVGHLASPLARCDW